MKKAIITSLVLFVSIVSAAAAEPGYEALPFIRISRDPSALTGGSAQLFSASSAYSVFSTPTLSAFSSSESQIGISYMKWAPSIANNMDLGASFKLSEKFGISLGASYAMQEPYDIINKLGNVSGTFTPTDMLVGAGAFFKLNDILAMGANVKYASSKVTSDRSYSAVAGDVFVTADVSGFAASLGVSSLGTPVQDKKGNSFSLPTSAAFAVGYKAALGESVGASAQLTGDYYLSGTMSAGVGAELSFKEMVAVRCGYYYGGESVIPSYVSAGAGISFSGFSLNATYILGASAVAGTVLLGLNYNF